MATKPQPADEFQTLIDEKDLEPEGSNTLSALAMFEEREYYKIAIYPNEFEAPKPFDLWYNRPMFGKLDPDGNPMFPLKTHMKQLVSSNPNVWVFDFVADAFNDFQAEFLFVNERDVAGTPFEFLNPQRGWSSTIVDYDNYMDGVYDMFTNYVTANNKDSEVVTFDKFMNLFYDFVNTQSPKIPITLSQYIVSPFCSPTTSGLMFDISLDSHGNDVDKYNHFINNRNFICYAETAQKFGFKIDKNFPGRLIADINSPVMNRVGDPKIPPSQGGQGYMRKYPKKPKKFKQKPPKEPERRVIPEPTSYPTNPFENGDKVSFLISHKRGNNPSDPTLWLILSDFSELKQRNKGAGTTQKIISENGYIKKGLETLKIQLHSMGYSAPQRITGKLINRQVSSTQQRPTWMKITGRTDIMIVLIDRASFSISTESWQTNQAVEVYDQISAIAFENALNGDNNDGFLYGSAQGLIAYSNPPRTAPAVYMEIPMDAVHLPPQSLPGQNQRFLHRVSYPDKQQKWIEDSAAAENNYIAEWNEWSNETMPNYEAAKLANKKAWEYYNDPFNQLTANNVFDKRYKKSFIEDMYVLREICMQFYYSYTSDNPIVTVTKLVRANGDTFLTKEKVIEREQISQSLINQKYPELYWIKQYLLIRNAELETKKTFDQLRIIRRRALSIYEKDGIVETFKYIKEKMPSKAYTSVMNLHY